MDSIAFLKGPNVKEALVYLASKKINPAYGYSLKKLRRAQRIAQGKRPLKYTTKNT